jgi:hypothetical protein
MIDDMETIIRSLDGYSEWSIRLDYWKGRVFEVYPILGVRG